MLSLEVWIEVIGILIVTEVAAVAMLFYVQKLCLLSGSHEWTKYKYLVRYETHYGQIIEFIYKDLSLSNINYIKLCIIYGRANVERETLSREKQIEYGLKQNRKFLQKTKLIER